MTATAEAETVLKVKIDKVDVDDNHRKTDLDVENLAASIQAAGLRQPISVVKKKGGRWRLVYGHRRLAACKLNKWEVIRAEDLGTLSEEDIEQLRTVENLDRKDLNSVEEAIAVAAIDSRLQESMPGEAHKENRIKKIAAKLGKPFPFVRDRLYLIDRCTKPVIALALKDSRITVGHLRELAKVGDDKKQEQLAKGIIWESKSHMGTRRVENVRIQTIEDLRESIDSSQRSLDRVPWLLDQKLPKLPACIGCPSNTATDETLFGTDHKGDDVGNCMNDACYRAKERAIEKAKKAVAQKISRMKDPVSDKAVVEEKCPPFLKVATAQRFVKLNVKNVDKAKEKAAKKAGKKTKATKTKKADDKKDEAIKTYQKEHDEWNVAAAKKINEAIVKKNPLALLANHLIDALAFKKGLEAIAKISHWNATEWTQSGRKLAKKKPKPVTPGALKELKDLVNTKTADILRLADEACKGEFYWSDIIGEHRQNPNLLIEAAKLLGVEISEQPAPPDLKNIKEEAPKPAAKKAKASKKSKKRPAKKKARVMKKKAKKRAKRKR